MLGGLCGDEPVEIGLCEKEPVTHLAVPDLLYPCVEIAETVAAVGRGFRRTQLPGATVVI